MAGQLRSNLRSRLWQIGFNGNVKIRGITTVTIYIYIYIYILITGGYSLRWSRMEILYWAFKLTQRDGESYFRINAVLWQECSGKVGITFWQVIWFVSDLCNYVLMTLVPNFSFLE